jgi:hypothetical protein
VAAAAALLLVAIAGEPAHGMHEAAGGVRLGDAVTNAGLTLQPPEGWTVEPVPNPPALVLAEHATDVDAPAPSGPRLTAQPLTAAPLNTDELIAGAEEAPLLGKLKTFKTKVGDAPGAGIEWTTTNDGNALTTRWITVSLGEGHAYTFVFEAPRTQFKRAKKTLEAVLATVTFDPASFPATA